MVFESTLLASTLFICSVYFPRFINCFGLLSPESNLVEKKKPHALEREAFLFKNTFSTTNSTKINDNIDTSLYDYKTFACNNIHFSDLELQWTSRILFQNTQYGNIAMHYDLYRQAFVYYSDSQISYTTLNLCAMKYVRIFLCRDFFTDSQEMPDDFINPFNQMKLDEEKREKEKIKQKRQKLNLNLDYSVFISKKKEESSTVDKSSENNNSEGNKKPVFKNNFRYLGKLANMFFTQSIPFNLTKKLKISDNYDYITFKDSLSPNKVEDSPFYKKFETLLV